MHIPIYGLEENLLDKKTGISYNLSTIYNDCPNHTHNHYEFFIVIDGSALHMINSAVQTITKGDFFLIRPSDVHFYNFYHSENFKILNLGFTQQLFQNVSTFLGRGLQLQVLTGAEFPPRVFLSEEGFHQVKSAMEEIGRLIETGHSRHIRAHAMCMIALFLEDYFILDNDTQNPWTDLPSWLSEVMLNMQKIENLQAGYPRMCQLAPCSPNHLCRTMKKQLGQTPTQYINTQRLNYSIYLLTQTDLDILDICETCGFSNLSHFYHLFQKQFGQSPIRFRREKI